MSDHFSIPVNRVPSCFAWDLMPLRDDKYFHRKWLKLRSEWESIWAAMDEEFRRINNEFQDEYKKTHTSQLGDHKEEHLPESVGWKVIENVAEPGRCLQLNLPVRNYKPEEITVKVKDGAVNLHAKHTHCNKESGERVFKECTRKFALPKDVKEEEIRCTLNTEGVLCLSAPAPKSIAEKSKERVLKIEKELGEKVMDDKCCEKICDKLAK